MLFRSPTSIVANSLEGFRVSLVSTLAITPSCFLRISKCTLLDDTYAISKPEKKAESSSVVRIIITEIGSTITRIEKGSCYQLPFIYEKNFYLVALAFNDTYFESIYGYNQLMLNVEFYEAFSKKYILIYQTDAFIFKDDLNYWCEKDYDYIGAPWIRSKEKLPLIKKIWDYSICCIKSNYQDRKSVV